MVDQGSLLAVDDYRHNSPSASDLIAALTVKKDATMSPIMIAPIPRVIPDWD